MISRGESFFPFVHKNSRFVFTSDGALGEEANITIRGNNSLTQSSAPLYIIDGFPSESSMATSLNSADIESIDILKDASATAIYGARGANGVIVITTKQGVEGKPKVNFSASWTNGRIGDLIGLQSQGSSGFSTWACNYSGNDHVPAYPDPGEYDGTDPDTGETYSCEVSIDKTPYVVNKVTTSQDPAVAQGVRNAGKWRRETIYEAQMSAKGSLYVHQFPYPEIFRCHAYVCRGVQRVQRCSFTGSLRPCGGDPRKDRCWDATVQRVLLAGKFPPVRPGLGQSGDIPDCRRGLRDDKHRPWRVLLDDSDDERRDRGPLS